MTECFFCLFISILRPKFLMIPVTPSGHLAPLYWAMNNNALRYAFHAGLRICKNSALSSLGGPSPSVTLSLDPLHKLSLNKPCHLPGIHFSSLLLQYHSKHKRSLWNGLHTGYNNKFQCKSKGRVSTSTPRNNFFVRNERWAKPQLQSSQKMDNLQIPHYAYNQAPWFADYWGVFDGQSADASLLPDMIRR